MEKKVIGKLALSQLAKKELTQRQMGNVKGGKHLIVCTCGCCYADSGGSSTQVNRNANCELDTTTLCGEILDSIIAPDTSFCY